MNQREGCCTIGRQQVLVQFLLILLTAIQVTYACDCQMLTWEAALCPASNKTVVLARLLPSSGELYNREGFYTTNVSSAFKGRYLMEPTTIYKNGSFPLLVVTGKIFLVFPVHYKDCGYHFTEEKDYVIGGEVRDKGGVLVSSLCQLFIPYEKIANNSVVTNILQGVTRLNCDNI
ncbi:hypothetical protein ACJMK2_033030 [Sinanodonta woodiana]|uniref:Uncharacterized protein n=1 Tax=Sinanodonta woodiana TaxID=1069815 RepID=A0ABD3X756_SINWO